MWCSLARVPARPPHAHADTGFCRGAAQTRGTRNCPRLHLSPAPQRPESSAPGREAGAGDKPLSAGREGGRGAPSPPRTKHCPPWPPAGQRSPPPAPSPARPPPHGPQRWGRHGRGGAGRSGAAAPRVVRPPGRAAEKGRRAWGATAPRPAAPRPAPPRPMVPARARGRSRG